jgi:hypothetical protein
MGACQAQYGINNVCGDLLFPGGATPDFYVGYVSDLSAPISGAQSAAVSTLSFNAYKGLVKFEGQKYAHKYDWSYQKGAGGNGYWMHRATVKLISLSTQDDVELQRLLQAQNAFIIFRNNNDQFFISGYGQGLTGMAGDVGTTGQAAGDDVTSTVILEGAEKTMPIRFLVTTPILTQAYLDARVI